MTVDRRKFILQAGAGTAAAGALWVAPSIIGMDAAFAGTSCNHGRAALVWSAAKTYAAGTAGTAAFTSTGGGPATGNVGVLISSIGAPTAGTNNGHVLGTQLGGSTENYLYLRLASGSPSASGYDVALTFPQQAYSVAFTLYEIDSLTTAPNAYTDEVYLNLTHPAQFTFTQPAGGTVTGNGIVGDKWIGGTHNGSTTSTINNVTVTANPPSPANSLTISYRAGRATGSADQWIGIGGLTWCW